ncbi:MAG TPA: lanthionine synthetase LanC family protein [Kofleriaceae bacterium]|nr:lanthionine synthetase LanC family protein [Kofleriaceae bacterium]
MVWTPILEGELATAATAAIQEIALDVATAPSPQIDPADRLLFWAYTTRLVDEPFAHTAYDEALDDVVAALRAGVAHPSLYGGLAGIGFSLEHALDHGIDDVLEVIDEALLDVLDEDREHDLARGLVGYGVYFLERVTANPGSERAHEGLDRVVRLLARATRHGRWHHDGVARGLSGVLGFLDRVARVANDNRAGSLCEAHRAWFATRPRTFDPAWCEGDAGIAAALWRIAPDLARDTALACARRLDAPTRDANLCHGTAGLAHLFNRFYQASHDDLFATAARTWFRCTLANHAHASATASGGLIEGSIGVALALHAAISTDEPAWDRLLLADLPLAA